MEETIGDRGRASANQQASVGKKEWDWEAAWQLVHMSLWRA